MNVKLPLIAAFVALTTLSACGGGSGSPGVPAESPAVLTKTDVVVGTGALAATGKRVKVNYTGWLYTTSVPSNKGQQFDTSIGKTPLEFTIGGGRVISGFDQGVAGMKVGGKRTILIPSAMGYGAAGSGTKIPPNTGLVFEVELVSVR
jgi:FKBP-type peptidyl-prolyl cis-trans isomerase FkpA